MASKGKLAEQSEATRAALLAAARALFAERGFAQTSTEEIVRRAKVTRGALYHHYAGKEALFRALYEHMEEELAHRSMVAAAGATSPMEMLRRGIGAFLDACLESAVQRIVLIDGLSVLGWEDWHEIGVKYNFGLLRAGLEAAVTEGEIPSRPIEPLAHLVQGALMRAGMVVARAVDPTDARRRMGEEIGTLLDALRAPPTLKTPRRRRPRRRR